MATTRAIPCRLPTVAAFWEIREDLWICYSRDPEAEERLWIPGDRNGTAVCLGLAWVLPNIILLASDYFEMKGLEMGFNIRCSTLPRHELDQRVGEKDRSRAAVPVQDLKIAIMEDGRGFHDIPDVVADGYLIIFELWAMLGKIGMVTIFMLKKTPGDRCRMTHAEKKTIVVRHFEEVRKREVCRAGAEDSEEARDGLEKLQLLATWLAGRRKGMGSRVAWMESELFYRVDGRIGVDDRIGVDGGEFQPNSEALAPGKHEQGGVAFPNMANSQLIPWITLLAIGFYIGGSAQMVLGGRISLGALVTTINIYKDRQNSRGRGHALKKKQLISESKEKNWREELPSPKITSAAVLACPDFFKRPAISQAVDVCCWRPEHNSGIV
ncbi:ATP-binding cassette sub-family B member 9 [Durusdinium trenchii]|uniref:ATP-binding cassette sub-family B member 9 n=1 Tax=Durusdinium trenchii TaxID=1381693 RepID=A0ABP0I8V7_9DINO